MGIIKVAAAVIVDGDKTLITRRAPKESFAGGWEFPGGKVEQNETETECLVREIKEELKIDVRVGDFCAESIYDYGSIHVHLRAYYCTITKGDISISVHDKYKWVLIDELLDNDLLPADIPIAKKIKKRLS